jgi:hypothetical protein
MTIFYCLRFETPPTWRTRFPYSYSRGTWWPNYTPRHRVPFPSPTTTRRATVEVFDPTSTRCDFWLSLSLMLRPPVSRPVCLGIKHPSGACEQIFIIVLTVAGLLILGALSDEKTDLSFTIPAGLPNAVIFGSESRRTRDHILLSQIWDFLFRRLLRLSGLRWRYSTPPPHRGLSTDWCPFYITPWHGPRINTVSNSSSTVEYWYISAETWLQSRCVATFAARTTENTVSSSSSVVACWFVPWESVCLWSYTVTITLHCSILLHIT